VVDRPAGPAPAAYPIVAIIAPHTGEAQGTRLALWKRHRRPGPTFDYRSEPQHEHMKFAFTVQNGPRRMAATVALSPGVALPVYPKMNQSRDTFFPWPAPARKPR
jgi:hypothetical protein